MRLNIQAYGTQHIGIATITGNDNLMLTFSSAIILAIWILCYVNQLIPNCSATSLDVMKKYRSNI